MIHTMSSTVALGRRHVVKSPGTGLEHWGTEYFGPRSSTTVQPGPQCTMSDMNARETLLPHYHGTTQFQLFVAGSGSIGARAEPLRPLMVQFKDHHTAYGPVVAGPQGMTFTALRIITGNSAPVYLDRPGYREQLKPSRRRNWLSPSLGLSIEPVMQHRREALWEPVFPGREIDDEMNARLLRLGAGMAADGPDPARSGGYYLFVANGSLEWGGESLPPWSMVVVEPDENAVEIRAGAKGVEVLVLEFPRENA